MTKLGLKTPIIEERDNSVLVSIRHEPLASPEETILDYLETHETIRNRVARQITYIGGDYVVKEIFGRLVARGLITLDLETRWRGRRATRETQVSRRILRMFLDHGGPIPIEDIVATFHGSPAET